MIKEGGFLVSRSPFYFEFKNKRKSAATPFLLNTIINMDIIKYTYKDTEISFERGNNVMINATEMAKPFGRRPIDYLRLPSTLELIDAIVRKSHISENQIVIRKEGAPQYGGGTWLHEDLALDFAQWLSVDFKLWCNDRIKELLQQGVTTINNDDETIAKAMSILQERLEESKQRLQIAEEESKHYQLEAKKLAPKAEYTDKVLQSTTTYTATQVGKELGFTSAVAFTSRLKEIGVLFRQSGMWLPTAPYCGKDYVKIRTHHFNRSDGTSGTNSITVFTEKGRMMLHELKEGGKL